MILKLLKHKTISKCYRLKKLFFSQLSPINEYLYDAKQIRFFLFIIALSLYFILYFTVYLYTYVVFINFLQLKL